MRSMEQECDPICTAEKARMRVGGTNMNAEERQKVMKDQDITEEALFIRATYIRRRLRGIYDADASGMDDHVHCLVCRRRCATRRYRCNM